MKDFDMIGRRRKHAVDNVLVVFHTSILRINLHSLDRRLCYCHLYRSRERIYDSTVKLRFVINADEEKQKEGDK
jgi:hypothetical protein